MRFKLILCTTLLPPALLLAGCGMSTVSSLSSNVESPALTGRSFGGQQPIVGATIEVIEMGTTGYGSPGTVLATTTTDALGNFNFAPGAYSCPQPDTPVYLLGYGGNTGFGTPGSSNPLAVTAAGLGTCTNGKNSYVVMNEVTTAALAFALSHFFSPTLGGSNASNDWFGGPSTTSGSTVQYSKGLVLGNSSTIPAMVSNAVGAPNQNHPGYIVDGAKIFTIANVLAVCINSDGALANKNGKITPCGRLVADTTRASDGVAPADTLQIAVQMALYPLQQVTRIYNLSTTTPPFVGLLSTPNDWTIGISYTTSALGLGVDTGTVSTLDIDANGNIWFPSNLSSATGAAYFDPRSMSFNGPFNSTSMVHPQQVAIDDTGYVWFNDSASTAVSGYLSGSPGTTLSVALPGTLSNGLTVANDNTINVGTTNGSTYGLADISADRSSYSVRSGVNFTFPVTSLAADIAAGNGITTSDPSLTQFRDYFVLGTAATVEVKGTNDNNGQVIYTGNDFVATRPYSGVGNGNDGLCIFSQGKCFGLKGGSQSVPIGIAIDGASNLWLANAGDLSIFEIPVATPGAGDGSVYLNGNGKVVPNEYLHGTNYGDTMTAPYGIGIDAAGNVWVSNAGCITNSCSPGSFTLSEIVGAAAPTITPVSAQIAGGTNLVGTEPTQ